MVFRNVNETIFVYYRYDKYKYKNIKNTYFSDYAFFKNINLERYMFYIMFHVKHFFRINKEVRTSIYNMNLIIEIL